MNNSSPFSLFHSDERYTTHIKNILTEYPDGSQIFREILQNSDYAKSTIQTFNLDHNTYPTEKLFYSRLDRYQGPVHLAINDSIFQPNDFKSLLSLANSEKEINLIKLEYSDQFMPFSIALNNTLNGFYNGTILRYSLRIETDAAELEISNKIYQISQIEELFKIFYDVNNINCLIFLKYIEKISFYKIKKGCKIPEPLHQIDITNAKEISNKRKLLANNIMLIITFLLTFGTFETIYKMKFCQSSAQAARIDHVSKNIGKFYCFLSLLGNKDDFSVSINGCFAISKNRRHLESSMDDDLKFAIYHHW
ncbi:putative Sacsin [Gigaspora margarita]|uniref:Putative Sacsin n=1 Tax=Gigaspora margarita TaxID=4874 RepID=A0A8H4ENP0_GIGMA|nr:putative Sacsin [Gigaspora margarita]